MTPTATTAANHRPAKRRTEPAYAAQTALGRRICVLKNHLTRHRCFRDGYHLHQSLLRGSFRFRCRRRARFYTIRGGPAKESESGGTCRGRSGRPNQATKGGVGPERLEI